MALNPGVCCGYRWRFFFDFSINSDINDLGLLNFLTVYDLFPGLEEENPRIDTSPEAKKMLGCEICIAMNFENGSESGNGQNRCCRYGRGGLIEIGGELCGRRRWKKNAEIIRKVCGHFLRQKHLEKFRCEKRGKSIIIKN